MSIKIGNLDVSYFKVGAADCSIYLGTTKLYPQGEPPVFEGKYKLTLSDSSVISAACDGTSVITKAEISAYTSTLVSAEIGDCVTSIGNGAFEDCTSLTSIDIPSSVTSIGYSAFFRCSGLTSIDIPSGVTTISVGAFQYCTSLSSITIPSAVTSIGLAAFEDCSGLTSITVNATTPLPFATWSDPFYNTNNCPIYVPAESVEAYKSASGWSTYADRIQAIPSGDDEPTDPGYHDTLD